MATPFLLKKPEFYFISGGGGGYTQVKIVTCDQKLLSLKISKGGTLI
jgi:hypothetical protein